MSEVTRTFILHWRDGAENEIQGTDIADAFNNAGYSAGALRALDYYDTKDPNEEEAAAISQAEKDAYKLESYEDLVAALEMARERLVELGETDVSYFDQQINDARREG